MNFSATRRIINFACFTFALLYILPLIIYWRFGFICMNPSEQSDLMNLKYLLKAAVQSAERGGKKVTEGKSHALNVKSKGKTLEGANDRVSDADYASHCAMYYSLQNTFPNLTIVSAVSEEHSNADSNCENQTLIDLDLFTSEQASLEIEEMMDEHVYTKDVTVWIDPLDATQEYTEALYEYVTTMVCVAIKGIPIIGVIHYPFPPRTYWGWFTKKVSSNLHEQPYNAENRDHPRVAVSKSNPDKVAKLLKRAFGSETTVIPAAGAGFMVMGVANGTYDVYLHDTGIKKWGLCAGNAIINTLKGQMTTTRGDKIDYSPGRNVNVPQGILVTRFGHEFYLYKLVKEMMLLVG